MHSACCSEVSAHCDYIKGEGKKSFDLWYEETKFHLFVFKEVYCVKHNCIKCSGTHNSISKQLLLEAPRLTDNLVFLAQLEEFDSSHYGRKKWE